MNLCNCLFEIIIHQSKVIIAYRKHALALMDRVAELENLVDSLQNNLK